MRFPLIAIVLLQAVTLANCSSANTPLTASRSWALAGAPPTQVFEPRVRPRHAKPTRTVRPRASDTDITGSTSRNPEELKVFSKEWYQREAQQDERIRRITSICRKC